MTRHARRRRSAVFAGAIALLAACASGGDQGQSGPDTAPASTQLLVPATTQVPASSAIPADTTTSSADTTTPAVAVASIRSPEIVTTSVTQQLNQTERSSLDGENTFYWPDGNIGTLDLGDGTTRFFAANGTRTAQTQGPPLNPGASLIVASQEIIGASAEFAYVAGGPVYYDADSGSLLLWYHAERHLGGDAANFHAAIGLARSDDLGATFTDLGIIIETNSPPDPAAPCCADVGGAPVIVHDGMFHLYFRDRVGTGNLLDVQLARASAPVDDVVAAALIGELSAWTKYDDGAATPGLGGTSSPLEIGNPRTSWFDVAWHDGMQRYLMVIAVHGTLTDSSTLVLTSSADGLHWTPRQVLIECDCELTYPSFLGTSGPQRIVGNQLDLVAVNTASTADFRWQDSTLDAITVTLSGELVTGPTAWTFDTSDHAWLAGGDARTETRGGALIVTASGNDPYISRAGLGLGAAEFGTVTITMSSDVAGVGQVFFTTVDQPTIDEARSIRFDVAGDGVLTTYDIDIGSVAGWSGLLDTLRFDPVDQVGTMTIDEIRVGP
jgi:hypothetical protein